MSSAIYDMAQAYKEQFGFNAVPLRLLIQDGKKKPQFFEDWHQYQTDFYDKDYPSKANALAIITGKSFNLTVIDIDAGFDRFIELYGRECCSYYVRTVNGGAHLYFLYDERITQGQWKDGLIVDGVKLDIRNDGGIVFAPPTAGYELAIPMNACTLKPVPEKFVKDFLSARAEQGGKARTNVQPCPISSSPTSEVCQRFLDGEDEAIMELTPQAIYNEFGCQVMPNDIPDGMGNLYMRSLNAKLIADAGVSDEMHEAVMLRVDSLWDRPMGKETIYNTYIKQRDKGFLGSIKDTNTGRALPLLGDESPSLEHCYFNVTKKLFFAMYRDEFKLLEVSTLGSLIGYEFAQQQAGNFKKEKDLQKAMADYVKMTLIKMKIDNQFDEYKIQRDPFTNSNSLKLSGSALVHTFAGVGVSQSLNINKPTKYDEIVKDYKKHFRCLDDILKWVVACRFTENRKASYLYIRVMADFGKSFFSSILKAIRAGHEVNAESLRGTINDIHELDILNCIALIIDEFTHFNKELKAMTHNIMLSPKFKLQITVPVYAKIFFSAEKSLSFFGTGADEQLRSRVTVLDLSEAGKLIDRPLYIEDSRAYYEACTLYIWNTLTSEIDKYIGMGVHNASVEADKVLRGFGDRIGAYQIDNLENVIEDCIANSIETITDDLTNIDNAGVIGMSSYIASLPNWRKELLHHVYTKDGELYTQKGDIVKIFECCIKSLDEHTAKKVSFKKGDAERFIKVVKEDKPKYCADFRGNKKDRKVFRILTESKIESADEESPFWAE